MKKVKHIKATMGTCHLTLWQDEKGKWTAMVEVTTKPKRGKSKFWRNAYIWHKPLNAPVTWILKELSESIVRDSKIKGI